MSKENLNNTFAQFPEKNQKVKVIKSDRGYGRFKDSLRFLDTPEGHIVATATLNAIRDFLKFRLNGKIEKAKNEVLNHNSFGKCEYYLGVNDTAIELLSILERMEI